jgi:hypothetical protein
MIDPQTPHGDDVARLDRIEAYLDSLLTATERAEMEVRLRQDPELRRQVELQARIDASLRKMYWIERPSLEQAASALASASRSADDADSAGSTAVAVPRNSPNSARWFWTAAGLAAAAAILWVMAAVMWQGPRSNEPLFAARPLADIYRDAIASGFEPSYECSEPERFADTFAERQGAPLQLRAMPAGMRMLGLSYTGGLSRMTTAMLCLVDGQPVIVFVDRAEADQTIAATGGGNALKVFREERDGLVFYEVTPLEMPRVTKYLAPLSSTGGGPVLDPSQEA